MNGYALASSFRQLRESWRFTSTEADLYYELVGIANERGWPAEFQYSNPLICATIGISEKSLIAARNRLKQAGLLDFASGHKRAPTCYKLLQKGLPQVSKSGSKKGSVSGSESDSPLYKEFKQKETELNEKLRERDAAAAAERLELEKKIGELQGQLQAHAAQPASPPVALPPPAPAAKWQPPSEGEVLEYMREQRPNNLAPLPALAEKWHAHYSAVGWKVGKTLMKDWRAAVRKWLADVPKGAGAAPQLFKHNPHQHALPPRPSAQPHGAAARLHTPAPDPGEGWGYPGG